jgi:hypothetical protein
LQEIQKRVLHAIPATFQAARLRMRAMTWSKVYRPGKHVLVIDAAVTTVERDP